MNNQLDVYKHVVFKAEVATNEVERTGLPMDLKRMISMQELFQTKKEQLVKQIQTFVMWDTLSLESSDELKELLFGKAFGKEHKDKDGKTTRGKAPQCALLLNLPPVKTTEKYGRPWSEVPKDELHKANPATDAETMQTLLKEHSAYEEILQLLIDYKALGQVTKNFLRPPDSYDELGEPVYLSGLVGKTDTDGFLRGSFSQLTETGRMRSYSPNMQNLLMRKFPVHQDNLATLHLPMLGKRNSHYYIISYFP